LFYFIYLKTFNDAVGSSGNTTWNDLMLVNNELERMQKEMVVAYKVLSQHMSEVTGLTYHHWNTRKSHSIKTAHKAWGATGLRYEENNR
jgi:hypothetical protein